MAFYNQNFEAVPLNSGDTFFHSYTANTATIHQLTCLSSTGVAQIIAKGGGKFVWSATTSQSIDVLIGRCTILDGSFVGFKNQNNQVQQPPYYK